jgi:hypothetical protein
MRQALEGRLRIDMRRAVACAGLGTALIGACSCGGPPATPSGPSPPSAYEQPAVKMTSTHFQILADRAAPTVLSAIVNGLESEYPRMTSDLHVSGLPVTSVYVWADAASFYAHMQSTVGTVWQGATGWVPAAHTISILVRSHATIGRVAAHEFAHVVSIGVNASIPNNPRWLWETVALYENHEFVDPTTPAYMRAGSYPTLVDLNAMDLADSRVYQVGFVLADYIVQTWGQDGLVRLIQVNGDVSAAFGITTPAFESGWHAFLHEKYGLP